MEKSHVPSFSLLPSMAVQSLGCMWDHWTRADERGSIGCECDVPFIRWTTEENIIGSWMLRMPGFVRIMRMRCLATNGRQRGDEFRQMGLPAWRYDVWSPAIGQTIGASRYCQLCAAHIQASTDRYRIFAYGIVSNMASPRLISSW